MTKVTVKRNSNGVCAKIDDDKLPTLAHILATDNDGGGLQIKNIADPTSNQDPVTLAYFNQHAASISLGLAKQVPFVNATANALQYSRTFIWDNPLSNLWALDDYVSVYPNHSNFSQNAIFGEGHTINASLPGNKVTDAGMFGWRNILGDPTAVNGEFSGSGTLTYGDHNANYGTNSLVGGAGVNGLGSAGRAIKGIGGGIAIGLMDAGGSTHVTEYVTSAPGAINISYNTTAQTVGHGAYAVLSAIIGGQDHNIPSTSPRSAIIGGNGIKARASDPDQVYFPSFNVGTLQYSDTGILGRMESSVNSYNQVIIQNASNGLSASTNFNVSNDQGTATTNFGEFGINSSGFTGTSSFSVASNVYLAAATTDLVIGTYANKTLRFVTNSAATDNLSITGAGVFTYTVPINGSIFTSTWTATANNQSAFEWNGTITSRNTASDTLNYLVIDPTLARNAGNPATQTATAVLINPTFSNSFSTQYSFRVMSGIKNLLAIPDNGALIASSSNGLQIQTNGAGVGGISLNGAAPQSNIIISTQPGFMITTGGGVTSGTGITLSNGSTVNPTSGIVTGTSIAGSFVPTSGTAAFISFSIIHIINQTGGANGSITYFDINPTRTSVGGTEYGILSRFGMNSFGLGATLPTALVHIAASTPARASLCIAHGVAPTSPVDGDFWTTTGGAFIRINGVTKSINLT